MAPPTAKPVKIFVDPNIPFCSIFDALSDAHNHKKVTGKLKRYKCSKSCILYAFLNKLKGWPIDRPRSLFLYEKKGLVHIYHILKFQGDPIIFRGFNLIK